MVEDVQAFTNTLWSVEPPGSAGSWISDHPSPEEQRNLRGTSSAETDGLQDPAGLKVPGIGSTSDHHHPDGSAARSSSSPAGRFYSLFSGGKKERRWEMLVLVVMDLSLLTGSGFWASSSKRQMNKNQILGPLILVLVIRSDQQLVGLESSLKSESVSGSLDRLKTFQEYFI